MDDLGVLVVVVGGWFLVFQFCLGVRCYGWLVLLYVWIVMILAVFAFYLFFFFLRKEYALFSGSHTLFTGPTSTLLRKKIKNRSHGIIHTLKNYFVTVF